MNQRYILKKGCDIEDLVKRRKTVGDRYYTIYYLTYDGIQPQIAVSASKKLKTAVAKNYEKRVIKEIIRPWIHLLNGKKVLVVAKAAIDEISFDEKEKRLLRLLNRINKETK